MEAEILTSQALEELSSPLELLLLKPVADSYEQSVVSLAEQPLQLLQLHAPCRIRIR